MGSFDNISHEWMLQNIPMDREVLRKWLKAGYVENRILFPTKAGTPQGGIISPTLANLTLDGLEGLLKATLRPRMVKGRTTLPKVHLVRYADDFIITGSSKELLEKEVKPVVEKFLLDRGMQLSPEKTRITHIDQGFDFLGQNLRKYGGKLLIQPSKKSTHSFLEKVRGLIRRHRGSRQEDLIHILNPVIRGWANYHRHIVATRTFKKVERALWTALWSWARRRHSGKSRYWIRDRYWVRLKDREVFATATAKRTPAGKPVWLQLVYPTTIKVRRHVKIRMDANPFDPAWRDYLEERAFFRQFGIHRKEAGIKPSREPAFRDGGL